MARQTALPPNLPPRLILEPAAAAYASVSVGLFKQMVEEGRMPKPRVLSANRKAYDIRDLDVAIDALPVDGGDEADKTWDD